MNGFTAMMVIFLVFAIGDFVSSKTKALCSMMFVSAVLFLVGFQTGLFPQDMFPVSVLLPAGGVLIAYVITHMGTLLDIKEFIAQWKTVLIGVAAMVGIGLIMVLVGPLVIDRLWAIAAAPVVAGGVVAAIIMGGGGTAAGVPQIAAFTALMVSIQGFIGFPLMSLLLRKEAGVLKAKLAAGGTIAAAATEDSAKKRFQLPQMLPETIKDSPNVLMAKLGIAAVLAIVLADLTGGIIHRFVMCLIIGIIAKRVGFLEGSVMNKANSFGFGMATILALIFANLAILSLDDLLAMIFPMFFSFFLGIVAICIFSPIAGKLLKVSPWLAIAIGISCFVGFPGTFIISNEVAKSMGGTEEERKFILDSILPKMLVAGFTTVTVGSVIMAGFMVNMM
jgi:hypothetical protein